MFTVEIRINGSMIYHIYGRNLGQTEVGDTKYTYEYYSPEMRSVVKGTILHDQKAGINPLICKILEDAREQDAKGKKHEIRQNNSERIGTVA